MKNKIICGIQGPARTGESKTKMAAKKHKNLKNRNPILRLLRFFAAISLTLILPTSLASRQARRAVLSRQSRFGDGGSHCGEGGSNQVKPMLPVKQPGKSVQILYNELFTAESK
jgi:hypothetical protein